MKQQESQSKSEPTFNQPVDVTQHSAQSSTKTTPTASPPTKHNQNHLSPRKMHNTAINLPNEQVSSEMDYNSPVVTTQQSTKSANQGDDTSQIVSSLKKQQQTQDPQHVLHTTVASPPGKQYKVELDTEKHTHRSCIPGEKVSLIAKQQQTDVSLHEVHNAAATSKDQSIAKESQSTGRADAIRPTNQGKKAISITTPRAQKPQTQVTPQVQKFVA